MDELTIVNTGTSEVNYLPESGDIKEIVKGCRSAIITYSLDDRGILCSPEKRYTSRKIVIFFDEGFCHETVHAGIADIMIRHSHSLSKSYMYRFHSGFWKKTKWLFSTLLYHLVDGFSMDNDTIDYRERSNDQNWRQ